MTDAALAPSADTIRFDNTYARLPERFFARLAPVPVRAPALLWLNEPLGARLGIDPAVLRRAEAVAALAGNGALPGAEPIATAYAGHQFGGFSPQLGDGRAHLLGEIVAPDGARFDMQLKGSGRTPFSRMGDGRAAVGPVMREVIVSEAMAGLAIPTTRALAAVATGEDVLRERVLPGAVLTRIAASHVRVGTFQYFAARGDRDALAALADYVIARHHPRADGPLDLLRRVMGAQADLVARWMGVGFIHGVMNTDNVSLAGETIDYGPCAFMDAYHPGTVFSSIDHGGRYAYGNQPQIAGWNMARFAEALVPLIDADEARAVEAAQGVLEGFGEAFAAAYRHVFARKLGLTAWREGDDALIGGLLNAMVEDGTDFTLTFRALADLAEPQAAGRWPLAEGSAVAKWLPAWRARLGEEPPGAAARLRAANPAIIARNHLVEEALGAAEAGDLAPTEALVAALRDPFDTAHEGTRFAAPPEPHEVVRETFCGT